MHIYNPITLLLGGFGLSVLCLAPLHAQTYTFKDLGTLGGNTNISYGNAVNDLGQVAGYSYTSVAANAFLSAPGGGALLNLGTLGGYDSTANGVNDAGQATGYARLPDGVRDAFFYTPGAPLKDLGTLGGDLSFGQAINATGQVVGESRFTTGVNMVHAFISGSQGGSLKDLGTLGGDDSDALAVNSSGQVTGSSQLSPGDNSNSHAYLSAANAGPLTDLGTLGGSNSTGNAINKQGQVAGASSLSGDHAYHAFLSGPDGVALTDLGTLGGSSSGASGLNDAGEVVGGSTTGLTNTFGMPIYHAFLFENSKMDDLNSLIAPSTDFYLVSASSISNTGYITGHAAYMDGSFHAFLLTPEAVPEASTTISLGLLLALGGVAVIARRKVARKN